MSGHVFDMVNRIKQNKTKKRKKFRGDNRAMMYSEKLETATEYTFPTVSESEMELIKIRIRRTAKANQLKSLYILAIVIVMVALVFLAFVQYFRVDSYTIGS